MTGQEWIIQLQKEGFENVQVVNFLAGDFGEHTHDKHTVHVILSGQLVITDDKGMAIFRPGDRVEFPAGTMHKAGGGSTGGSMIVGFKN